MDRRAFLEWSARAGVGVTVMLGGLGMFAACANGDRKRDAEPGASGRRDLPATLKVGVVAPLTGVGQFAGDIVTRSLRAAQAHIEEEGLFPGTTVSYEIVNAPAEQLSDATQRAYAQLVADPAVIGILWCTVIGLKEARAQIRRDGIPVIAVFADPWSEGLLYPDSAERSIFQYAPPDKLSHDLLMRYAKEDRGYESVGLLYDSTLGDMTRGYFEAAADTAGIEIAGIEEFKLFTADFGAQLQRFRRTRCQCLVAWGVTDSAAAIVKGLDALGAGYVDTPRAKGPGWHPQVLGWAGGTGSPKWAELAGDAAKTGTVATWYMGGLVAGPSFPIRDWLAKHLGTYPTGGEDAPANCYWSLLEAARRAGSTDRGKLVTELERLRGTFAGLEFGFGERHLAVNEDELVIVTVERHTGPAKTDPPYRLGREWEEVFLRNNPEYVGPTLLARPTLAANRRSHPDQVEISLTEGWGTICTVDPPGRLGADLELTNDCKVH
jgi:ABC-type branched-subunit amino acid transport system substrate-binding protein